MNENTNLVKEEKKKYYKDWRSKNKDKVKIYNDNYWRRRIEKKRKLK